MPERIYKLQPNRVLQLRGFDSFAAAAALHSATATSFELSGTFRDPADFAVLVLWDADNFYEHPSLKYLPDFNFQDLVLTFDVAYSPGVQPIDSPKYNWIDWATLDCIRADGSIQQVRLWDYATLQSGEFTPASGTFTFQTGPNGPQPYDRVTLWFQNLAYDFIVPPGIQSVEYQFFAGGTGTTHSITINGRTYSHTESNPAGESSADQAAALVAAMASDPQVTGSIGSVPYAVKITARPEAANQPISISGSDGNAGTSLFVTSLEAVIDNLRDQINGTNWITANSTHALLAASAPGTLTLQAARYGTVNATGAQVQWVTGARFTGLSAGDTMRVGSAFYSIASVDAPDRVTLTASAGAQTNVQYVAPRGGYDGNMIRMYSLAKTSTLRATDYVQFADGNSEVTWRCKIDFTARGVDQLRQCWLTFAPPLANGAAFQSVEWSAVFTNWNLTGPEDTRRLQVAGPGSVRVEENSAACKYTGNWGVETGFYSQYFARRASTPGDTVTISYTCQFIHDLYLGTSLYVDRGIVGVKLDGSTETDLNCALTTGSAINTRRQVRAAVPAGEHTVTVRLKSAGYFYFDFLEAAVRSDVPDPLPARANLSPALDFDTDHSYKLPPTRILWMFDRLGFRGPMNEYIGVFWWNERQRVNAVLPSATVSFSGTWAAGDAIFLTISGTPIGKSVFPADSNETIAAHFAAYINEVFVGVWAAAGAGTLTVTSRSPAPAYNISMQASSTTVPGSSGVISVSTPAPADYGTWQVDPAAANPLNRAARDWHTDLFAGCRASGREIVVAGSMELVFPPSGYAAVFPNQVEVATATGFGALVSQHCAAGGSRMIAYQKKVYKAIADLQADAGLTPEVQFGEFLWWFFDNYNATTGQGGMAFYDAETSAAAQAQLGRPLHLFRTPNDDPGVNNGADARFLRDRLRDHVAALAAHVRSFHPNARIEVLYPYDVNHPTPVVQGGAALGGRLNRFINLPAEWERKETSGLDRIKIEALAFSAQFRDLNLATAAITLPLDLGWPRDSVRYLIPVFGVASPWHKEYRIAVGKGVPVLNLWAFDHVCLYGLDVRERQSARRAVAFNIGR